MAFGRETAIVSIAVLVMIVAMTEVDARISVGHFGRNLLESQTNNRHIKVDERRNLYNIVGSMAGKHCCNKLVTTCCAPAPAPKPSRKPTSKVSTSETSKASTPKASTSKTPKAPTPKTSTPKTPKAPAPKTSTPKTPKAPAPKTSTSKTPKAPTPKASTSKTPKAPAPTPSVFAKLVPKGFANAPLFKKAP